MRIVVNNIAASQGGAMTILKQFYEHVRALDGEDEWYFLLGGRYLEETDRIHIVCLPEVKRSHLKKVLFDLFTGKKIIDAIGPDVIISLQNIITFGVKAPQVVYVHQSLPYQDVRNFSFFKRAERKLAFYQHFVGRLIDRSIRKADGVIVQTRWMRETVARKTGVSKDRIIVALPDITAFPAPVTTDGDPKRFFYPTADNIYKNNAAIVEACNRLNNAGVTDFEVLLTLPEGRITHPNIRCVGYLDRDRIFTEYCRSALLFPSYIESVGLPLLEAMQCGAPILAADCPFAREVLDSYRYVRFFDPFSPPQLAECMHQVLAGKLTRDPAPQQIEYPSHWGEVIAYIKHFPA